MERYREPTMEPDAWAPFIVKALFESINLFRWQFYHRTCTFCMQIIGDQYNKYFRFSYTHMKLNRRRKKTNERKKYERK